MEQRTQEVGQKTEAGMIRRIMVSSEAGKFILEDCENVSIGNKKESLYIK
jgi:hypothetical protein